MCCSAVFDPFLLDPPIRTFSGNKRKGKVDYIIIHKCCCLSLLYNCTIVTYPLYTDVWNRHRESENTKLYEIGSGTKLLFTFLSLKLFRQEERVRQSFNADCFFIVWPRPVLNVDFLVRRQELNSLLFLKSPNPQPTLPVRDVTHIPWSQFLSKIFILTSLNDTHILSARAWTPALTLHLTNPCAKRKVLSLTKPKGKIYKTKSLRNYITLFNP